MSDEEDLPLVKEKKEPKKESKKRKEEPEEKKGKKKVKTASKDEEKGKSFSIGNKRKVSVRTWKGRVQIDIREFYEKNDEELPGKKGISLSLEQFKKLQATMPQIEKAITEMSGGRSGDEKEDDD
eukprot:TRINITY_DN8177_c0_g1_i1.p1 TRINITY_DN8177_c0_g1~~TRINITY_DN8177_c0_g1_i1.p1  ORF type:complete len:135 (+),score=45.09 TRINITY_DN8177_c0_g1_i1:33-407(+)